MNNPGYLINIFLTAALCLFAAKASGSAYKSENWDQYDGYMIKKVDLEGLKKTKPYVVYRELRSIQGNHFSSDLFAFDIRQLEKLDIFAQIKPNIRVAEEEEKSINVLFEFIEIPNLIIHPTGEYTEENFFSLGVGGISTNLWGRNHFFEGSYKSSFTENGVKRASLEYKVPRVFDIKMESFLWLADERRLNKLLDSYETYQVARLSFFWHFYETPLYKWTQSLELISELFSFDSSGISHHSSNRDINNGLGFGISFDTRNFGGNPNLGWFMEINAGQVGGILGGDVDYWQSSLDLRRYQPLSQKQHLLFSNLLSWQDDWKEGLMPIYKKYWIGGANTVRGYEHGVRHGKNQWLFTAEYRYLWLEPRVISLWLFDWKADLGLQPLWAFDVGRTWNNKFSEQKILMGQTLGFHILIPYKQMIRLEFGMGDFAGANISFQFHLAAEPKPVVQRYRRR